MKMLPILAVVLAMGFTSCKKCKDCDDDLDAIESVSDVNGVGYRVYWECK